MDKMTMGAVFLPVLRFSPVGYVSTNDNLVELPGQKRINKIHHMWVECTELNGYVWLRVVFFMFTVY